MFEFFTNSGCLGMPEKLRRLESLHNGGWKPLRLWAATLREGHPRPFCDRRSLGRGSSQAFKARIPEMEGVFMMFRFWQAFSPSRMVATLVVAVLMAGFPTGLFGQEVVVDAEVLMQANKTLSAGDYQKAADLYGQVTSLDGALFREAILGRSLCFAMLGFTASTPEKAIESFRNLVREAAQSVPLEGLENGNIHINRRFITDLLTIFGKTGSLGGGDAAQGMILESDAQFLPGSQVIDELGTDAQKHFAKFFGWSMALSNATGKLAGNDFEGCLAEAAKVSAEKPEHIKAESKALQTHGRRMVETRDKVDDLKSALEEINLDPGDPNEAALEKAKDLSEQLLKLLKK